MNKEKNKMYETEAGTYLTDYKADDSSRQWFMSTFIKNLSKTITHWAKSLQGRTLYK
jgi:hypothetical protein